jgi:predicted Zn-dependent protease
VQQVERFIAETAACTPEKRAQAVRSICRPSRERGLNASGAFATRSFEYAVGNSLGVLVYYPATLADLRTVIMSDSGSGYSAASSLDVDEIDAESLGREAMDKALRSSNPADMPPGEYTVILEEYAVSLLIAYLAYMGFGAQALQEGRASGVVYDTYTAGRQEGKESTGHALPAPSSIGPFPWNIAMESGNATKEEMLASTKRGLWVSRLHYVRPVHPQKAIITGMTRDGTFLIEDGEIVGPVKNMRFTQSILEALSDVEMLGQDTKLGREGFMENFIGGVRVPAVKIGRFTFTSATEF